MFGSLGKLGGNLMKTGLGAFSDLKKGIGNALMTEEEKRKEEEYKLNIERKKLL